MKSHQRSSIGNETIEEYMHRDYKQPKDFESFLYVSQLLQAHGIKIGIEAHRRNKDRCMGSLYWQINDCWPVASWSSIDYYGKWKALHYTAKKSFENFLISFENKEDDLNVFVVSDSLKNMNAILKIELLDFDGQLLKQWEELITVEANKSNKHVSFLKNDILNITKSNNVVLHAELLNSENNKIISENLYYFSIYKELKLINPELTFTVNENMDEFELILKTKKLAKDVYLSVSSDNNFSDNYFDMLPNTDKKVTIKKSKLENLESFIEKLKVISLFDSYIN
jgi:beta-mannosidase